MSWVAQDAGFELLLDGVSRLGGAKALVEASAKLIDGFKPDDMSTSDELLFQRIIQAVLRQALDERDVALAILGEQGIDARQTLAGIEDTLGRVDRVDPR